MSELVPVLTPDDMAAIAQLVYDRSGIRLTDMKTALVNARLQKRLRARGFSSFEAYVSHVRKDPSGAEQLALVDALTTNKTSFFREPDHFRFLADQVVPELVARHVPSIAGWSAGCATGEEPYSIVVTLLDALQGRGGREIEVLASDVSSTALATARRGVYPLAAVHHVAEDARRRYFERGVLEQDGLARVRLAVRQLVRFEHVNLLDPRRMTRARDFIWCRNTLMYFDRPARQQALASLLGNLAPHGYLFVSHAENLTGLGHDLCRVAPGVYRRRTP
ncbi:MAG: protein-glutamate O-methyltransferase CheR [Vicinamibacterales bacterium]